MVQTAASPETGGNLSGVLSAGQLDSHRFDRAQCDALFAAILIDDEVDEETPLPAHVSLDWEQALLIDGYRLCRQLWTEGVDRDTLTALVDRLAQDRDLSPADRLAFKYARAKFKHVRFACALFGARHRYPIILDWMTTALGHLQDAFKTGMRGKVWREAMLNRLFLSAGPQALVRREIDRFDPATPAEFRAYTLRQIATLRDVAAREAVTGAQFHATRKIASRQVAFYDTIRTLAPTEERFRMSRAWAAINGLMGAMHDELVERRVAGTQDYHREHFALPDEIRFRLREMTMLYPREERRMNIQVLPRTA
jgi:hypothetical protein